MLQIVLTLLQFCIITRIIQCSQSKKKDHNPSRYPNPGAPYNPGAPFPGYPYAYPAPDQFISRQAIANRKRGDVLLIEEGNLNSQISITLDHNSEPMYVASSFNTNELWIGDRNNSHFYIYDITTLHRKHVEFGCNGIFHTFYNELNQLWIVCDIDKTILIMDTNRRTKIKTIKIKQLPEGYKPHDITCSYFYGYVTLINPNDKTVPGYVIQYDTKTFKEVNRLSIGGDPHLFMDPFQFKPLYLFVASQNANTVYKITADTLKIVKKVKVNGAHGIFGTRDTLWVTDITSDGTNALYVFDINRFGDPKYSKVFDSIVGNPHNIMTDCSETKLFITHTVKGIVSVYSTDRNTGYPNGLNKIIFNDEGSFPFGIMCVLGPNSVFEHDPFYAEDYIEYVIKEHGYDSYGINQYTNQYMNQYTNQYPYGQYGQNMYGIPPTLYEYSFPYPYSERLYVPYYDRYFESRGMNSKQQRDKNYNKNNYDYAYGRRDNDIFLNDNNDLNVKYNNENKNDFDYDKWEMILILFIIVMN
eukprot:73371_1